MNPRQHLLLAFASVLLPLAGCSSAPDIIEPPRALRPGDKMLAIRVDSEPSGYEIVVNNRHVGRTPQTVEVIIDPNGRLREPLTIEPDATTRTLPGVVSATEPVRMHWDAGEAPPRIVRLGIRDPGGSISYGGSH